MSEIHLEDCGKEMNFTLTPLPETKLIKTINGHKKAFGVDSNPIMKDMNPDLNDLIEE